MIMGKLKKKTGYFSRGDEGSRAWNFPENDKVKMILEIMVLGWIKLW